MNWPLLVGQFRLKISIYKCFVVFGESLKTQLPVLLPRLNLYHMQIFTAISSHMNFFTNPLLPTPSIPSSALVVQRQTFGNSGRSRGHFNGGWRLNQSNSRGNQFAVSRPDHRSFQNSSFGDNRQGSWQRNRGQNPRCQLCQNFGHTAPHCPQFQQRGYGQQPTANLVQRNVSSTGSVDWFPDTGANQHVIPDLATLTASEPYLGNDNLYVGNGKGLPISHLGHTKIHTPNRSHLI